MAPLMAAEAQALANSKAALLEEDPVCWAVSRLRVQNALIWTGTLLLLLAGTGFSWGTLMTGAASPAALGALSSLYLLLNLGAAGVTGRVGAG